ncbi:uncharacterized protein [Polyergus mexicanus]|uniref:uncharacterized protein n=1 Tax=Polyergus mexicanus TaxID=615972 RepID=UPI0038B44257
MSNRGFIVVEFSDGIQVIPKIWLQSEDVCKYPSHFKTDLRLRKAIEKEEIPNSDWPSFKINRIFGEYSSLQKADAKAEKALYTSDMDTEKEAKSYRKYRARKVLSSSESEEESCTSAILPPAPCPPAKRQRLCNTNETVQCESASITRSWDSAKKYKVSSQISNLSSYSSSLQDANDYGTLYERDEEALNIATREKNRDNSIHRHMNKMEEVGRSNCTQGNQYIKEKENNNLNHQFSQAAIDANGYGILYERDEEAFNIATREKNGDNLIHRHINKMEEVGRSSCMQRNRYVKEKENDDLNHQFSQTAIVDHFKRLTREIVTIKYDMRQALSLLDILVERTNKSTECASTKFSFGDAENRFPLQTVAQLAEVEEILKVSDSQHNTEIRVYIKSIGGTCVDDTVKRTLYKTFSNKLAEKYNWEGRRGKEPLHKLELMKVIFRSIFHNIPDSDQGKIQRRVMEWFRHSKARHENEKKRTHRCEGNVSNLSE